MIRKWWVLLFLSIIISGGVSNAQSTASDSIPSKKQELRYNFDKDGKRYVKLTFLNQVWLRYTELNSGTLIEDDEDKDDLFDIGLRRTRIQLFGQVTDKVFFYTQLGQNNLATNSPRKQGVYIMDALGEYKVAGKHLEIGAGLTGWSGLSRYASPSVGSLLGTDAPLYQLATLDISDQFVRKYSIYAKGKLGKLDYRLAVSDPMEVSLSPSGHWGPTQNSSFANTPGNLQFQGYFMYQFLDQESNLTPYNAGTYLGKKRVFNIGVGFINQQDAMWRTEGVDNVKYENLNLFAIDVFYDAPINIEKGTAITAYAAFNSNDYGKNYVRNVGVMNPNLIGDNSDDFNGPGNGFPMMGTGTTLFTQVGYLFKRDLFGNSGTLQPYASMQYSDFDLLNDKMLMYETGVNWLINGHGAKLSLNYQSRPVYSFREMEVKERKGMAVMQFQISI